MGDRWWDGLTDLQISVLKSNERPLGLCPSWFTEAFKGMLTGEGLDRELEQWGWNTQWRYAEKEQIRMANVYRLRPDWQRPAEKKGGWEYSEVTDLNSGISRWIFDRGVGRYHLHESFSMVGFGGIEFQEWPGRWFCVPQIVDDDGEWVAWGGSSDYTSKPATPKRCRFWREK